MEDDDEQTFSVAARAVAESAKALKVEMDLPDGKRQIWVPKSVIHDDSEVFDNAENKRGKLVLHGWFAREEGLAE
jgi:hypothetical protein